MHVSAVSMEGAFVTIVRRTLPGRSKPLEHFDRVEKAIKNRKFVVIQTALSPIFCHDQLDYFDGRACERETTGLVLMTSYMRRFFTPLSRLVLKVACNHLNLLYRC